MNLVTPKAGAKHEFCSTNQPTASDYTDSFSVALGQRAFFMGVALNVA
jgi:hypothetical protein